MKKTIAEWAQEQGKTLPKNSSGFLNEDKRNHNTGKDYYYIKYKNKTRKLINWRIRKVKLRNEVVEVLLFMRSKNIIIKEISQITGIPMGTLTKLFSDMKLLNLNEFNIIEKVESNEHTIYSIPLF